MSQLKKALTSSLGQKFLMSLSGVGLVVFLVIHLIGNSLLYKQSGETFNMYAHTLESYTAFVTVAEIGLLGVFLLHILTGIWASRENQVARPKGYKVWRSKAVTRELNPSNRSSRTMIISGLFVLIFLVIHVYQFRIVPGSSGYTAQINGTEVMDLHRIALEVFRQPLFVALYVIAMIFIGTHLRHGFWSAFQSAGLMTPKLSRPLHLVSLLLAMVLSLGFLFIPVFIYFGWSGGTPQ